MAKQHGIIRLEGSLGDLLYYKRDGKYYVRRKTMHQVDTDPRFERTHRKGLDFGTASRASKLSREALGHTVKPFTDSRWAGRMTARFVQAVAADSLHECGKRQVSAENLAPLKGFQLHKKKSFDTQELSPKVSIDHKERKIKISVHDSLPTDDAQLVACIVSINFQKNTYTCHHSTCSVAEARHSGLQCDLPGPSEPGSATIVTLGVSSSTAGAKLQAMAIIDVSAHPIEKAVTPEKSQHPVRQKQHPQKTSYISRPHSTVPRLCTTKIKNLKKVVQLPDPFFQTHPLYDKSDSQKKCRTTLYDQNHNLKKFVQASRLWKTAKKRDRPAEPAFTLDKISPILPASLHCRGPWTVDRGLLLPTAQCLRPKHSRRHVYLPVKRMHKRRSRVIPHLQSNVFDRQLGFFQQLLGSLHP